jgi:hypothetical protein
VSEIDRRRGSRERRGRGGSGSNGFDVSSLLHFINTHNVAETGDSSQDARQYSSSRIIISRQTAGPCFATTHKRKTHLTISTRSLISVRRSCTVL